MMRVRFEVTLVDDMGSFDFVETLPVGFDYYMATIRTLQKCHREGATMTFRLDNGTKLVYDPKDIYEIEAFEIGYTSKD